MTVTSNLKPVSKEFVDIIESLQDYINDMFEDLKSSDYPVEPEEFNSIVNNHFCNFLDTTFHVENALELALKKISDQYEEKYNENFGLAKLYYLDNYRNKPKSEVPHYTNHPSVRSKGISFD